MNTTSTPHPFLLLPGLPAITRPMVARLMNEPLMLVADLAAAVARYRHVIQDSAAAGSRANVALGLAIAQALDGIIACIDERTEPEALRVIQVAVRFFVIEHDGFGHDLQHEDGLFGDARVVNAMLRWFGRDDLALDLPTPAEDRCAGPRAMELDEQRA